MQTNFIYLSTHIHRRHICTRIDAHTCAWTEDPAHSSAHIHKAVQLAARNGHIIFHDGQVQGQGQAVAGDRAAVGVSLGTGGGGRSWSRLPRDGIQLMRDVIIDEERQITGLDPSAVASGV